MTDTTDPIAENPRTSTAARIGWAILVVATLYVCTFSHLGAIGFMGPDEPRYHAQTLVHVHGSTEVAVAPRAVAALGPGDADAVHTIPAGRYRRRYLPRVPASGVAIEPASRVD